MYIRFIEGANHLDLINGNRGACKDVATCIIFMKQDYRFLMMRFDLVHRH